MSSRANGKCLDLRLYPLASLLQASLLAFASLSLLLAFAHLLIHLQDSQATNGRTSGSAADRLRKIVGADKVSCQLGYLQFGFKRLRAVGFGSSLWFLISDFDRRKLRLPEARRVLQLGKKTDARRATNSRRSH